MMFPTVHNYSLVFRPHSVNEYVQVTIEHQMRAVFVRMETVDDRPVTTERTNPER
jgi:hypothetical protein